MPDMFNGLHIRLDFLTYRGSYLITFVRKSNQNSPPSSCARWSFTCCGWLLRNDPFGARSFTLFSLFVKDMSSQMIPAKTGALPRLSRIGGRGRRGYRIAGRQSYASRGCRRSQDVWLTPAMGGRGGAAPGYCFSWLCTKKIGGADRGRDPWGGSGTRPLGPASVSKRPQSVRRRNRSIQEIKPTRCW